jgi:hypothetical protein
MMTAPPNHPGHDNGTAFLKVHDPDMPGSPWEVICPACGDDNAVPYAQAAEEHRTRRGPWPRDIAQAKLEFHCGMLTEGVDQGLHLLD